MKTMGKLFSTGFLKQHRNLRRNLSFCGSMEITGALMFKEIMY
jgi:hypothetical protein